MIYEIIYLIIFLFGGRYILNLIKGFDFVNSIVYMIVEYFFGLLSVDINFTNEEIYNFIKYVGIGLFCIAILKFLHKIFRGGYKSIKLNDDIDKNNKIYNILSNFQPATLINICLICFLFMIPSPFYFVMRTDRAFILKCFRTHFLIVLWFSLFTQKHIEITAIRTKNIFRKFLNDYSEILKRNNGVKTDEAIKIEQDAVYVYDAIKQATKTAAIRGAIMGAGAVAAGTYAGKKIGDAIVKNNENLLSETIIKDGKEVRVSKSDVFVENLNKELGKL